MGKATGVVLLLVGLALGPGSLIANRFFSGRVFVEAPLAFAPDPAGRRVARFAFSLPADALPAAVVIQVSASHGPALQPADAPADTWTLRLLKAGQVVREQPMHLQSYTIEATSALVFKESIPLDTAAGSGAYTLEVRLPAEPELSFDGARVVVRAGVSQADPAWLTAGLALIAAGLVLVLMT